MGTQQTSQTIFDDTEETSQVLISLSIMIIVAVNVCQILKGWPWTPVSVPLKLPMITEFFNCFRFLINFRVLSISIRYQAKMLFHVINLSYENHRFQKISFSYQFSIVQNIFNLFQHKSRSFKTSVPFSHIVSWSELI